MRCRLALILVISLSLVFCASPQKKIEKAREKDPRYQYNLGLFYLNNGEIDEAIKHLNKSLSLNPRYYLSLSAMGLAYSMKGNFEGSVEYFQKCLKVNPAFTEAHNYLGAVYQEMGLIEKAEEEYKKALSDETYESRELPYYNLGRLFLAQDKFQEALDFVEDALAINNRMAMAHNLKGVILERLNRYDEAMISYKEAIKIVPGEVNFNFNLAVVYFKNKEFNEAREIFEKILPKVSSPEMKEKIKQYLRMMKQPHVPSSQPAR